MGIHGLASYLREKKRLLSTTTHLTSSSKNNVPIIVDGWSFIYDLYQTSNLPWVYGGEHVVFTRLVKNVVQSWIKVGLHVYFVFDGACPDLKFATVISRLTQSHVQPAQIFFRTSPSSRSTGRFLNENKILPPLAYSACICALEALRSECNGLDLHFADEEGDPFAVELAGRLGGYVVGNDSDFVILNADGYRGYIPLDEMVWLTSVSEDSESIAPKDDDFQTVKNSKTKRKPSQKAYNVGGLLPPDTDELSLSFIAYSPDTLAKHFKLPVTLLPLFGALVGNDFSKESETNSRRIQTLFFDRSLSLSQRIDRVASTMNTVISPGAPRRKAKHQLGSVMDLIDRTVNALLARLVTSMGSGEVEQIVEKIVNATLQYAIPKYRGDIAGRDGLWATSVCALHDPEACSLLPMISHNVMRQADKSDQADPKLLEAREKYLDAYRNGHFSRYIMDILSTGSSWERLFLENPDLETVGRSIGRPIREWIYSILDDTVGLPTSEIGIENRTESDTVDMVEEDEDEDEDELIDVVESDSDSDIPLASDLLAPLKGELHWLHSGSEDDETSDLATEPPASIISHRTIPKGSPVVIEYLRRGTRIASEEVNVKPLSDLLSSIALSELISEDAPPLTLCTEDDRLTLLLRILHSDIPSIRRLPAQSMQAVLAIRWVVKTVNTRWEENGSKEREQERWNRNEARAFLSSFTYITPDIASAEYLKTSPPPIEDRNIQLTAQMLMALDAIEQLSQTLLLTTRIPNSVHQFSGKAFHSLLTGTATFAVSLPAAIWECAETGLTEAFQQERVKKAKKPKSERSVPSTMPSKGAPTKQGLFALLGGMDG